MAAGFNIIIGATDRITGVLDAINKRMAKFAAPLQKLHGSVNKFGEVSGLKRVGSAFTGIAREATGAFQALGQIVAPLGIISGAASVAGIYRMVSAWSDWAVKLGNTAKGMGVSAEALGGLQNAARLAGASAESMTSGLQTLGQTMYDAIGGRAPEAVAMFRTLGISFSDATGHARSVTDVLPEVADKIAGIRDPMAQAKVATAMFGGAAQDLLPFLRRGSEGIREYTAMAERYGVTNDAAVSAANEFRMAQTKLSLSVEGLANSVSVQLAPVIAPLLTQMADWIGRNREWIASGIGDAVRQFAEWVKAIDWTGLGAGIQGWLTSIGSLVESIGGWLRAIEAVALVMAAPILAPIAGLAASLVSLTLGLGSAAVAIGTTLVGALTAGGSAFTAFGAILVANPIGAIITLVGGLGIAGYELYQHWDEIKGWFGGLWDGLKKMFNDNTGYLRTALEVLFPLPMMIIGHWDVVKGFFTGMWDGIKSAFDEGWAYVKPIIDKVQGAANWVANSWVGKKLGYAATAVEGAASAAGGAVVGAASSAIAAAPGVIGRAAAGLDRAMGFDPTTATAAAGAYKPLLDMLGKSEGTDKGRGYNETLGYGKYTGGDVDLSKMTLAQVGEMQKKMLADPTNTQHSSAVGRYQFVSGTLRDLSGQLGLDPNSTRLTPQVQDQLAVQDLRNHGGDRFVAGQMSGTDFARGLSKEWASVANPDTGRSYYGQATGVDAGVTQGVLNQVRIAAAQGAAANQNVQIASAQGAPRAMPIAQAAGPERQIATADPSTAAGDQKAAMASRVNITIDGKLPPGLNMAASGGDGVNLGGPLVERSRLGSVAA